MFRYYVPVSNARVALEIHEACSVGRKEGSKAGDFVGTMIYELVGDD